MPRSILWNRSWSPMLCLIFYFTAVSWLLPWHAALGDPGPIPSAKISPDLKAESEDLSNDELHALLSLLAGTNSKVNPPDTILLSDLSTTASPPVLVSTTTTRRPPSTRRPNPSTVVVTPIKMKSTTAFFSSTTPQPQPSTTSIPPTTTKPRVIIVPVTPTPTSTTTVETPAPTQKPRALVSPPTNDLVQQLTLLNSLLGTANGNQQQQSGGSQAFSNSGGFDNSAAAEAAAALFGVAPAALIIPPKNSVSHSTTPTTTTTPRPKTTTMKPVGKLDDTSQALQSLALLNVLLGNTGDNSQGNNSAAAALLGLGTAASSPAVRQTQTQSTAQQEQEAAVQLTNLLLQSQGNPQLQNFVNNPSNMDASSSNQLSGLLGILGTLGSIGGQGQQTPSIFNLGQQNQQQQQQTNPNFLSNIFNAGQRQNQQQQQQASLLTSLFGGQQTTPAPSLPGFGLLSSMASLGSSLISTVSNTLGGSRGDGRPRVRGVDTRLGLGYRFGDNADAQLMWEIGPQLFTEPLKEGENGLGRKRQTGNAQSLLESASGRVLQMFKPQSQYTNPNHVDNPPWRRRADRRVDTIDEASIVSKESLSSVASSLPHQSLKTLKALLDMKNKLNIPTPTPAQAARKLTSLYNWYTSTTPATATSRKIHIPAQLVGPPTEKFDNLFNYFNKKSSGTTSSPPVVQIPSTQMTPPKSSALDKFVSWYMGGDTPAIQTTAEPAAIVHIPNSFFFPSSHNNGNNGNMNMDPSNFLKRSSLAPPMPPTSRSMTNNRNFYDKRNINPKTNLHSSLTTYEKYLLGMMNDDDLNKSQDMDAMASAPIQQGLGNRRNHQFRQSNLRNGQGNPGHQQQRQRNSGMPFRQNQQNHFGRPPLTHPPFLNRGPNRGNPNFMPMSNRRQLNFANHNHNKINNPMMQRPISTTLRPPDVIPHNGMRRRFGPQRQFQPRKTGFSFASLNPFAGLFGKKNRPPHNPNHFNNNPQQFNSPMDQGQADSQSGDSYNPYASFDNFDNANNNNKQTTNFETYERESNAKKALANIRNAMANNNNAKTKVTKNASGSDEDQDTPTAASMTHSTKVKYNPHQNFIPEAEDSYLARNAVVSNPKLRTAELEKLFGEMKKKNNGTKTEKNTDGAKRKNDDYDEIDTATPANYLMGLVKNALNTRIQAKFNNKEKMIPELSLVTEKPILPRRQNKRPRIRTKLRITDGKPEIVLMPHTSFDMKEAEERPIIHVGEDMSFEDLKSFYDVSTTTKKPKTKKKKQKPKITGELSINEDIELSEEEDENKDVFIDIDSGEVSVLKPVASLTAFEPPKEEDEEEDYSQLDEETRRKHEIYKNLQKELQHNYIKMKKAQLRAIAKQKRKEELAAKGLDESLDMVSKYFDLVEETDKDEGQNPPQNDHHHQESQRHPYLSPPPPPRPGPSYNRDIHPFRGYTSNTSYSKLRKNRRKRRSIEEVSYLILM